MLSFIKKGDLVFDVGANYGNKSKLFLEKGAKVIAFEPQEQCLLSLWNLDTHNIIIENIALDKEKGEDTLFISNSDTLSSMSIDFISETRKERFKDNTWNETRQVKTDTLDNMIKKYGVPKYIKIDVEGYEYNVLQGLTQPIEYISIEFTPELLDDTLKCLELLKGKFNYVSQENTEFMFREWQTKEEIISYLKSINDYKVEFGDIYIYGK